MIQTAINSEKLVIIKSILKKYANNSLFCDYFPQIVFVLSVRKFEIDKSRTII